MGSRIASLLRGGIGGIALAALGLAIAANALWLQGDEHPAPLFASRDADRGDRPAVPTAQTSEVSTTKNDGSVPPIRPRPDPTIMAIQQILADRGYYAGQVDGIAGQGTERAVKAYQADVGHTVSGIADADFLLRLQQDRQAAPLPAPAPKNVAPDGIANMITSADPVPAPSPIAPAPTQVVSVPEPRLQPQSQALNQTLNQTPNQALNQTQGQPAPPIASIEPEPEPDPKVKAVQEALSLSAYGALEPDGLMGPQTADAIRRFQLDQGLAVTGEVDETLVSRLIRVGAMASN